MASSYDNDLRLNEQGTGDNSGSWGTVTNLNLEMIAEAFSYGTRVIANASSDNITLADGALDADRSMYLRLSGGGQACTVTFLPATISKVWLIENATSATLTFTQGSNGANVAVLAGQVKMIATDGGGSTNGVVYDLLTDVNMAGTTVTDIITANQATVDDIDLNGKVITMTGSSGDTATLTVAADGALAIATTDAAAAAANISITADGTFTATGTTITLDSAGDIILDADGADVIFKDGGTSIGTITNASSDLVIKSNVQDKDILLKGDDGASEITALTLDMSEAGAATFNSTVTRALTRGSIDVGNSSGVSSALAAGGAGTFLTSDGTDLSFATISTGTPDVVFPSDWASPTNTYTSTGTWSKGSLDDDDYVWFYLIGGGGGGAGSGGGGSAAAAGGEGGSAMLLYGKARALDGCSYVVAAAKAGRNDGYDQLAAPNETTVTLSAANGSRFITTGISYADDSTSSRVLPVYKQINDSIAVTNYDNFILGGSPPAGTFTGVKPSGVEFIYKATSNAYSATGAGDQCIFGGGNGGARYSSSKSPGLSQYAGAGGASGTSNGSDGTAPGGGGGGGKTGTGGDGARGEVRVYHV